MGKKIANNKDEFKERYNSGERVEVCTINGVPHLIIGDQKIAIEQNDGYITFPDRPYSGGFINLPSAAEEINPVGPVEIFEEKLPISKISNVRRDFLDLDEDDRNRLAGAFNHVHSLGWIDTFNRMHEDLWPSFNSGGWSAHFTPQFLPWHRWMIREMEKRLQQYDSLVTLPYWDSTRDEANDWDGSMLGNFFGGENNSGGRFDHWDIVRARVEGLAPRLPSLGDVWARLRQSSYAQMRGLEVGPIHVGPHNWVGGYMARANSPKDPLFYLHHANVDRIWALWQLNHPDVMPQYDPARTASDFTGFDASDIDDRLITPPYYIGWTTATIRDVLSHRALSYRYTHDQRLEDYSTSQPGGPLIVGDPDAFTIAPQRIEVRTKQETWKVSEFQLINDTDFAVEVAIERFPENAQGRVDGFVWLPFNRTIQPRDSHEGFVVFAPQHTGMYNFNMKVHVDPVGAVSAREITIPVIGFSTW